GGVRGGGGEHGSAGVERVGRAPESHGMSFAHESGFNRGITGRQGVERVPNHYYFHNEGGHRYWHFFDRGGLHWYGFYFGPRFFWFPFFSGYWWWYDENLTRWAYWYNGYWWWNGPGGVPYIYYNDDYIPYTQYQQQQAAQPAAAGSSSASSSEESEPKPPSAPPTAQPSLTAASAPAKEGSTEKSPDGKREVQIVGSDGGAFLFDESKTPPVFMKYLGAGATSVKYVGGTSGKPLSILVNFKDGTFNLFDAEGNPADRSASPPAAPSAPAAPAPAH
ncbi:MAG: hypothetical protein ACHQ49_16385, partial [Elusimicrobiota bacterium]